ncbi:rho GTPase-activating protein 24 isoform X3 [Cricetulus griseus]|uniref:rho GTPase-activating protein 24 isoform X3 n=1 Tax=Cricetulus griseus TaxID=10029 RepID=UPI000F73867E|nr:rho GTPase-activating protein 24 isoform X3 [Cricetulus griseus]
MWQLSPGERKPVGFRRSQARGTARLQRGLRRGQNQSDTDGWGFPPTFRAAAADSVATGLPPPEQLAGRANGAPLHLPWLWEVKGTRPPELIFWPVLGPWEVGSVAVRIGPSSSAGFRLHSRLEKAISLKMEENNDTTENSQVQGRQNATKCGWLRKQGGFVKTWHTRWFVLKGDQLYYFKDEDETKPLLEIGQCGSLSLEKPII